MVEYCLDRGGVKINGDLIGPALAELKLLNLL